MNSEINDRRWFWAGVALQFATGYTVAFLVYQIGTLLTEGTFGAGFVPGLATAVVIIMVMIGFMQEDKAETAAKCARRQIN